MITLKSHTPTNKWTRVLKLAVILPVLAGALFFIELLLPLTPEIHTVESKKEIYRKRFKTTTYEVNFNGYKDQFTREIFEELQPGDSVEIYKTPIHKETRELLMLSNGKGLINSTPSKQFEIGFALAYILTGFIWIFPAIVKYGWIRNTILIAVLFGTISLIRVLLI